MAKSRIRKDARLYFDLTRLSYAKSTKFVGALLFSKWIDSSLGLNGMIASLERVKGSFYRGDGVGDK
jgi:hypothetical protein